MANPAVSNPAAGGFTDQSVPEVMVDTSSMDLLEDVW